MENRADQQVVAEEELVRNLPRGGIVREIVEHGAHHRRTLLMRLPHGFVEVGTQALAHAQVLFADAVDLLAVAPHLVFGSAGR